MARITQLESSHGYDYFGTDKLRSKYSIHDLRGNLRGNSEAMEKIRQTTLLFARSPANVLIPG